jgi:hypothetical protein
MAQPIKWVATYDGVHHFHLGGDQLFRDGAEKGSRVPSALVCCASVSEVTEDLFRYDTCPEPLEEIFRKLDEKIKPFFKNLSAMKGKYPSRTNRMRDSCAYSLFAHSL